MFSRLIFYLLILESINCFSQIDKNAISGKINLEKNDNLYLLRAQILNKTLLYIDELDYNFVAVKKGVKNNYSQNKQAGKFSLKPEEEKMVATLRVNLNRGEELKAYLFIKKNNKLIQRDTLFIGLKKSKVNKQNESSFFLKGIVLDEAITKIGKDFYDFFYQKYLLSGRKYPFVIKVKEKPTVGRNSIISIEIEDAKVHEFFARPEEEYLKSNVDLSLRKLVAFSKRRKSISNKKF